MITINKFKVITKAISLLIIISMLAISSQTFYADEEEENYGFEPDDCDRIAVSLDAPINGFSSSYDPRNLGIGTPTKNQSPYLLCWMYATTGAVEQYASLKYGSSFDLSELHGAISLSNSIIPHESNSPNGYLPVNYNSGGNTRTALQYFTNWNEPIFNDNSFHWKSAVAETTNSFIDNDNKINQTFQDTDSVLNVTGAMYLNYDSNTIKRSIIDYGGVITSIYYRKYKGLTENGNNNNAYFFSSEQSTPNHAVVIVGWDDYYSTENFTKEGRTPNSNGAWLVRDSHGNNNSYFWLSYEEGSLLNITTKRISITGVQKASNGEKMLSYDYRFMYGEQYTNNTVYYCNVYNTSEYNNFDEITKVMMYLKSTGCNYEIRVIPLSDEADLPTNLTDYGVLATGNCNFEGYITKELSQPVDITDADKCAIIIKVIPTSSDSKIYYPYESNGSHINEGESFVGIEENNVICWTDHQSNNNYTGNLCIRPVLHNSNYSTNDVTISPTQVVPSNSDVEIQVSSINRLFCIHTPSNYFLREGLDYLRTDSGITLKQGFLNALYGNYAPLVFEFNDDIKKTIYVNPATINNVQIEGQPIVGETLTAQLTGQPALTSYNVNYQWQYFSVIDNDWLPIPGATQNSYIIDNTYFNKYLRVTVTPKPNGNVITGNTSNSTAYQAVILGDCNFDGFVDIMDVTKIQKYLAGRIDLNNRELLAADFNKNGVVDTLDSNAILSYLSN